MRVDLTEPVIASVVMPVVARLPDMVKSRG
jgi:hypothetical protein